MNITKHTNILCILSKLNNQAERAILLFSLSPLSTNSFSASEVYISTWVCHSEFTFLYDTYGLAMSLYLRLQYLFLQIESTYAAAYVDSICKNTRRDCNWFPYL